MLDLCSLYGSSNRPLLAKMLSNLFQQQPKYSRDWEAMVVGVVLPVFPKMAGKVLSREGAVGVVRLDRARK